MNNPKTDGDIWGEKNLKFNKEKITLSLNKQRMKTRYINNDHTVSIYDKYKDYNFMLILLSIIMILLIGYIFYNLSPTKSESGIPSPKEDSKDFLPEDYIETIEENTDGIPIPTEEVLSSIDLKDINEEIIEGIPIPTEN
jgi:hypothetical protein|tara:strand:- start:3322 stop:3741 length:420 start_codon:yes stop_codon:yes gene_type:complete